MHSVFHVGVYHIIRKLILTRGKIVRFQKYSLDQAFSSYYVSRMFKLNKFKYIIRLNTIYNFDNLDTMLLRISFIKIMETICR